ncbi:MAG: outer membrane protein assembly factor BamD [Pseudomonadota bacterium]|nr:outer membrane protein assembly factor BamD [Pseudomonadota bacterium]
MKFKTLFISISMMFIMNSCAYFSEFTKEVDETKEMGPAQIYSEGKSFLDAQDFPAAIKYFEILESRYPFGVYATQAMLDLAYAHYEFNQKDEAIVQCNRFIRLNPNHPNVDYAYYLKGLSNFEKTVNIFTRFFGQDSSRYDITSLRDSFDDFSLIVNRFPNSKYVKDSRNRLLYLKNKMASNELYIAKYYRKRQAHVAAIKRVKYMLENFGGTPSTEEGLVLLIDSYNDLGIYDLAYDSSRVLVKNYPNYIILQSNTAEPIKVRKKKTIVLEVNQDFPIKDDKSWYEYIPFFN